MSNFVCSRTVLHYIALDGGGSSRRRLPFTGGTSLPALLHLRPSQSRLSLPRASTSFNPNRGTQILIVQHPYEAPHKSLLCTSSLTARHLSPLLDRFPLAIFLFPSFASTLHISSLGPSSGHVLIAFDATWQNAREMVSTIEEFLSKFAIRVCLGVDESASSGSIYDSELILRKEPFSGCMSTMEVVARFKHD